MMIASEASASVTSASVMPPTVACSTLMRTSGCSSFWNSFWIASIDPRTSARRMMLSVCGLAGAFEPIEQVFERDVVGRPAAQHRGPLVCGAHLGDFAGLGDVVQHVEVLARGGRLVEAPQVHRHAGPGFLVARASRRACRACS